MKHIFPVIFIFIFALFSYNTFAGNSIFSYEKEKLQNDFSELILIENAVVNNNLTLIDLQNLGTLPEMSGMLQDNDRCSKGTYDAAVLYKPTGPTWGSFCCTAGTNPLFGLILALVMNNKVPKDSNLGLADYSLLNDADYINCYRAAALQKKKKAIWTAFGVGTVVYLVVEGFYISTYY